MLSPKAKKIGDRPAFPATGYSAKEPGMTYRQYLAAQMLIARPNDYAADQLSAVDKLLEALAVEER